MSNVRATRPTWTHASTQRGGPTIGEPPVQPTCGPNIWEQLQHACYCGELAYAANARIVYTFFSSRKNDAHRARVSSFPPRSLHSEDVGIICNNAPIKLQLVDGPKGANMGRLEVLFAQEWGTVSRHRVKAVPLRL